MLDEEDGDIEVIVTNNRPIATVTGVGNSDAPYYAAGIVTLLLCGGWIFGVVLYKEKSITKKIAGEAGLGPNTAIPNRERSTQ